MRILCLPLLFLAAGVASAQSTPSENQPLTAEEIMARVATNQDRSQILRKEYVYKQHIHILTHKGTRLMREESADYDVVPTPDGSEKQQKLLSGRYWHKRTYETFEGANVPEADSLDGGLIKDFRDDLLNDKTKDGLGKDLFPLTSEEQKEYAFTLLGRAVEGGRSVYHIGFRPKNKDEITWAGEAFIDTAEFEPVRVFTKLSRRMPFMVRTMLGTDVPGLGFNVVYQRLEEGVWFPATFGTEFRLRAVFFINREISISLQNTAFERTHVKSTMRVIGPAD